MDGHLFVYFSLMTIIIYPSRSPSFPSLLLSISFSCIRSFSINNPFPPSFPSLISLSCICSFSINNPFPLSFTLLISFSFALSLLYSHSFSQKQIIYNDEIYLRIKEITINKIMFLHITQINKPFPFDQ